MPTSVASTADKIIQYVFIVAVVLLGTFLYSEVKKNSALETQAQVQAASIKFMQEKQKELDDATNELNQARTTLQGIKGEIRKSIKKALEDETYKAYRESLVHPESARLLRESSDRYRGTGTTGTESAGSGQHTNP